ncbi:MAG: hypothetical protein ACP5E5_01920 [Acidobacteriaceae bacterium]
MTYASTTTSVCTVSGSTLTAVSAGTCSVTASQAGNTSYLAATPVTVTFSIDGASQTITFATVTPPAVGSTTTLTATASSGLAVSFTASPSTVCTVSGDTLTAVSAGTCMVTASQPGDSAYAAATSVPQTITISAPSQSQGQTAIFSSGFTSNMTTLLGGALVSYAGSNADGYNCTNAAGVSQCGSASNAGTSAATSYAYSYYQTYAPITGGEYVGMSIFAPGITSMSTTANTTGLTLNGQTSISFMFNTNAEWVTATGTPNVLLELTTGNLYTSNGKPCYLELQTVFAATGGATPTQYTIPLSDFVLAQNCGNSSLTAASALAQPISRIDFQGDGGASAITVNGVTSNSNLTTAKSGSSPLVYPTTVALEGPITFQ